MLNLQVGRTAHSLKSNLVSRAVFRAVSDRSHPVKTVVPFVARPRYRVWPVSCASTKIEDYRPMEEFLALGGNARKKRELK